MTVSANADGVIRIVGVAPQEDAERLLSLLIDLPAAPVDWTGCQSAHTAVLQVLLVARRSVIGVPRSEFLSSWIAPILRNRLDDLPA